MPPTYKISGQPRRELKHELARIRYVLRNYFEHDDAFDELSKEAQEIEEKLAVVI